MQISSLVNRGFTHRNGNANTHRSHSKAAAGKPHRERVFGRSLSNVSGAGKKDNWPCDVEEEPKPRKPLKSALTRNLHSERLLSQPLLKNHWVSDYEHEIDNHIFALERANPPRLEGTELTEKMRAILIDWLVDVHLKLNLKPETLFLTANIIDKYLGTVLVRRRELQLLGVTSMLIACKYEEVQPPKVATLSYLTDCTYATGEILKMEQQVLKTLCFSVAIPSSYRFLQTFAEELGCGKKVRCMAEYIVELALLDCQILKSKPSLIAASALYIANRLINKTKSWKESMVSKTRYGDADMKHAIKQLIVIMQLSEKSPFKATRSKFALAKYMEVSKGTFKKKISQ